MRVNTGKKEKYQGWSPPIYASNIVGGIHKIRLDQERIFMGSSQDAGMGVWIDTKHHTSNLNDIEIGDLQNSVVTLQ